MGGGGGGAFVLGFLQREYRFLSLNSSDYYLDFVPIFFDLKVICICLILMFLTLFVGLKVAFLLVKKND
jgi:hypothetical protein